MLHIVNRLGVPTIDLAMIDAERGALKVTLEVPDSTDLKDDIPFLEVTRNEQAVLFNGARQDMISKLSSPKIKIGEVEYDIKTGPKDHGNPIPKPGISDLRELSFKVSSGGAVHGDPGASLKHNAEVIGAFRATVVNFDARRMDMYDSRARDWFRDGGVTFDNQGETYTVTKGAAKAFISERHFSDSSRHVNANDGSALADGSSASKVAANQRDRQFFQALQGFEGTDAPNKSEMAALALNMIRQAPGFKPDQAINVMQGKHGFIVSQGEGPTSLALQIPQFKHGDFESIALAQPTRPQQVAMPSEQPERKGPTV